MKETVVAQVNPFQAAREAYQAGKYAKSDSLYTQAIDANLRTDEALYGRAAARYELKNYTGAKTDGLRLRKSAKFAQSSYVIVAMCEGMLGDDAARLATSKEGLRLFPKAPSFANSVAWELAVSSNDAVRNGREAVRLARRACELTSFRDAAYLDTLAAACAEVGDFANAIKHQRDALTLFSARDREHVTGARQRLALYQTNQAYRENLHGKN